MVRFVLLEFIDSPFMQAVGVGIAIAAGIVVLGAAVLLWQLTRAGLRQWKRLRAAPGPAPIVRWLGAGLLLLPAVLVGLVAVLALAGGAHRWPTSAEGMRNTKLPCSSTRTAFAKP